MEFDSIGATAEFVIKLTAGVLLLLFYIFYLYFKQLLRAGNTILTNLLKWCAIATRVYRLKRSGASLPNSEQWALKLSAMSVEPTSVEHAKQP
jgi:hypothetical protein